MHIARLRREATLIGEAPVRLSKKLERASGGTIDLKVNEPGALVPALQAIQAAVASGVAIVFQWALPVTVLAFLVSFFLREVPLRDDVNVGAAAIEGMEEAGFGVLGEPAPVGMDEGHG